MKLQKLAFLALPAALLAMSSCLSDEERTYKDYTEWRNQNTEYFDNAKAATINGVKQYEEIVPDWDKGTTILMQWHNNRSLTADKLVPLSNSTVDIKYILTTIEGDTIDSSYSQTVYGDSIYRCRPNNMITGFQIALTNMHVGDTITTVIPYNAGYGYSGSGSVQPYSTLIFGIKLVGIDTWETPSWRK